MIIRYSKILCIIAMGIFCALTLLNNLTDYYVNFPFIERALMMKDIFPGSTMAYRAIHNPILHHIAYIIIIFLEGLTTVFCLLGAWKLFQVRHKSAALFNPGKNWAIAGLTLGFLTWQVLFMSIGGEWFGMWMSQVLSNAIGAAFQIFITMLMVLIYVSIKDE